MSATKILWGQVLLVFAIILAATWSATQWTAAALAYQPELGRPWFHILGHPAYPPPAFYWWWLAYDAYAPRIFLHGAWIAASGGLIAAAAAIAIPVWRAREARFVSTCGSAHWASQRDVRRDWRNADLVSAARPLTLFLIVPPSDISRTRPLIRPVLNQIGRRLTEELTPSGARHRLLPMLDEFPALGRLDFSQSALAFMAGYGVKAFPIAQSLWENGYCQSFNSKLRDDLLDGEIFYSLAEAQVLNEAWRRHCNGVRAHPNMASETAMH